MSQKFNPLSGQFDLVLDQASEIKYIPSGDLITTNVQAAIDEIETQILALPDPIVYVGTWDASTNTPTLSNTDVDVTGNLYQVTVDGIVDFGAGSISFVAGDKVVSNGTEWQKWDLTDAILSVNSQTGIVSLTTTDIPEGTNEYYTTTKFDTRLATKTTSNLAEGTNLYFTDERSQDSVGTILVDTATIDFTYDDATPTISAIVIDGSITNVKIASGIDAVKIADGSVSNTEYQYLDGVTSSIQTQLNSKTGIVPGDITKMTFASTATGVPVDVTGATFPNAVVRSFNLTIDAEDGSLFESFNIKGVQRGADWMIQQQSVGDLAGIAFSITTAGQIQYISDKNLNLSFKADTIGI